MGDRFPQIFDLTQAQRALGRAVAADESLAFPAAQEYIALLGEDRALAFAQEHEVASHVAHALLSQTDSARTFSRQWFNEHQRWHERITRYLAELDRVAAAFADSNIQIVALKNVGIARALHTCAGCNPMGDLDVLVTKKDFRNAHKTLLGLGYRFEFRSPLEDAELEAAEASGGAEYRFSLSDGSVLWLELQWRPVAGRWIQPEQEPKAEDLLVRSQPISGSAARLMAPEDNLVQVALHTAKHSYVRAPGFRLHTDVDRIVRHESIDWDRFLSIVNDLQIRTATFYSLEIAHQVCHTPIPADIRKTLAPRNSKHAAMTQLLRSAGLFHPLERKFSRLSYFRFTSLLFDHPSGLWRAVFPRRQSMTERYGAHPRWQLPLLHMRRITDLLFRRLST